MMTTKKRAGRPKEYTQRMTIQHGIEMNLLHKVDRIAGKQNVTRTEYINNAIRKEVANGSKH